MTLFATGSEVHIALEAKDDLASRGVHAAVVSMPSWELFRAQDAAYRASVLGEAPRVSMEAAATFGWSEWLGDDGRALGLTTFGTSAPYEDAYAHFGLTAEKLAEAAQAAIASRG